MKERMIHKTMSCLFMHSSYSLLCVCVAEIHQLFFLCQERIAGHFLLFFFFQALGHRGHTLVVGTHSKSKKSAKSLCDKLKSDHEDLLYAGLASGPGGVGVAELRGNLFKCGVSLCKELPKVGSFDEMCFFFFRQPYFTDFFLL